MVITEQEFKEAVKNAEIDEDFRNHMLETIYKQSLPNNQGEVQKENLMQAIASDMKLSMIE